MNSKRKSNNNQTNYNHFGSIDTVVADRNSQYHSINVDRLIQERNGFSNYPYNISQPPVSFSNDSHIGEITGKIFDTDETEQGMPMRSFDTGRSNERYAEATDFNPHLDFSLYNPQSSIGRNVSYNDPSDNTFYGFIGNDSLANNNIKKSNPLNEFHLMSNSFTMLIHNNLKMARNNQSIGTPSFGILISLLALYRGSTNETEYELKQLFRLNKRDAHEIIDLIYPKIKFSSSIKIFNAMLVPRSNTINHNYKEYVKQYQFTEYYDPRQFIEETQRLNNLIKSLSQNTVKKLLPEKSLATGGLISCSNIYCKPYWRYHFNSKYNVKKTFNGYPKRNLEFMTLHDKKFLGCEDNSYKLIELDLFDPNLGMGFIIPKETRKININDNHFYTFLQNLNLSQYNVIQIPKIENDLKFKYNLTGLLSSIGLESIFNNLHIDDAIIGKKNNISEFLVRFTIILSEKGKDIPTVGSLNNIANTTSFIIDKPFIYYLRERTSNTIIFIGEYY